MQNKIQNMSQSLQWQSCSQRTSSEQRYCLPLTNVDLLMCVLRCMKPNNVVSKTAYNWKNVCMSNTWIKKLHLVRNCFTLNSQYIYIYIYIYILFFFHHSFVTAAEQLLKKWQNGVSMFGGILFTSIWNTAVFCYAVGPMKVMISLWGQNGPLPPSKPLRFLQKEVSTYTRIHNNILQTNNQSWLSWYIQPKLSVTRIPLFKNWNFSPPFSWIMDTTLSRYDKPLNQQHELPRPTTNLPQTHSCLTPRQHMTEPGKCWQNTTSTVSLNHQGKSTAIFHLSRMLWD